ncbi:MAG: transferrin receptor-like dimerization domain-containing protein, partial [bacterium]
DYTPFLQHLGIASLNLGFGGEDAYGQYHSAYDSIDHFRRFMDPGFLYGETMAKVAGRVMLRLANAELLPFEFTALAEEVGRYVDELQELADTMRRETAERNRLLAEGAYTAAADPEATYVPPEPEEPVPHLAFAPLKNGHARLEAAARRYEEALRGLWAGGGGAGEESRADGSPAGGPDSESAAGHRPPGGLDPATLAEIDRLLYRTERALTRPEGLPGREWFVHHLYAPGFYTGYGVKTVPGAREAIEQREWAEADRHLTLAGEILTELAAQIDRAAELLEGHLEGGTE